MTKHGPPRENVAGQVFGSEHDFFFLRPSKIKIENNSQIFLRGSGESRVEKSDYYSPFVADILSSHTFPPFHTFSTSYVLTQAMASSQQPLFTDEDCNLPSQERVALLKRLDHLLGDVPLHFWAACHLCDLQGLALLVKTAELNPNIVLISARQTYPMVANCKLNTVGLLNTIAYIFHRESIGPRISYFNTTVIANPSITTTSIGRTFFVPFRRITTRYECSAIQKEESLYYSF